MAYSTAAPAAIGKKSRKRNKGEDRDEKAGHGCGRLFAFPSKLGLIQQPLQMLLIFLSTFGSSARIAASPGLFGPCALIPPVRLPAEPVVSELLAPPADEPDDCAVPALLVPGGLGSVGFPAEFRLLGLV